MKKVKESNSIGQKIAGLEKFKKHTMLALVFKDGILDEVAKTFYKFLCTEYSDMFEATFFNTNEFYLDKFKQMEENRVFNYQSRNKNHSKGSRLDKKLSNIGKYQNYKNEPIGIRRMLKFPRKQYAYIRVVYPDGGALYYFMKNDDFLEKGGFSKILLKDYKICSQELFDFMKDNKLIELNRKFGIQEYWTYTDLYIRNASRVLPINYNIVDFYKYTMNKVQDGLPFGTLEKRKLNKLKVSDYKKQLYLPHI
jgi:hypothetical protein